MKYAIEHFTIFDGWINIITVEVNNVDRTVYFDTMEDAKNELCDILSEPDDDGNLEDPDQYRLVPVSDTEVGFNRLFIAARQHGIDVEPNAEVGDLQEMLHIAWDMMTEEQQTRLIGSPEAQYILTEYFYP